MSRFEGLIPPIVDRPSFSIRRHSSVGYSLESYTNWGKEGTAKAGFPPALGMADYETVCAFIRAEKNIMVTGGTGSGKTEFLNACMQKAAEFFPDKRVLVIQDQPEPKRYAANTIFLRTSPWTNIQALGRASMRLFPGSVCVGEVRDSSLIVRPRFDSSSANISPG